MDQKTIEAALNRLQQLGAIRLQKPGSDWYQMYCPFHNSGQERKPSFGVLLHEQMRNGQYTDAGFAHCFTCGYAKPMPSFIKDVCSLHSLNYEAYEELKSVTDSDFSLTTDSLIPEGTMSNLINTFAVESLKLRVRGKQEFISEEELAGYRFTVPYMYQRRLTDAVIEKYDVGYDAKHLPPGRKKALPCVTFPVRDIQGRTLFICRRSIEGKYFNLPTNVEKSLYGIYELPPDTKEVIICESIFNALTCVVYGYPAVALLGTGTSHEIDQLKRLGVSSYVICLDNDDAGRRGTEKLKKALTNFGLVWTMTVPEGKDVNDLDYSEFIEVYNNRQ